MSDNRSSRFLAAFSVNVVRIIEPGSTPSQQINFKHRAIRTSVLPVPGPAGINNGPLPWAIAFFWAGSRAKPVLGLNTRDQLLRSDRHLLLPILGQLTVSVLRTLSKIAIQHEYVVCTAALVPVGSTED